MTKPKCTSKSQSCGNACIERKDVCRQKLSAEMDKAAAQLAGSLARQRNKSRTDLTFEQLQAKFPTEGKFGIQTSKVEKSVDAQGNITHVLTQTAADGSGDTLRFTMLTDTKGNHYSVDDGVIKPITNARKDSHWQEAHFAALRGLAAKNGKQSLVSTASSLDLTTIGGNAALRAFMVNRLKSRDRQQSYVEPNVYNAPSVTEELTLLQIVKEFHHATNYSSTIARIENEPGRAYTSESGNVISIDQTNDFSRRVVWHELAHTLELQNRDVYLACLDFRNKRASGPPELLSKLTGTPEYGDEVAIPDKFASKYVGKVYNGLQATEVLSTGLEAFIDPPAMRRLYLADKEQYNLMLKILDKLHD